MKFRPCIDLHNGQVKQIVGSTLSDAVAVAVAVGENENDKEDGVVLENFSTDRPASDYALMYRRDNLVGGHVIMLGPGNEDAATSALRAYPGGMQVGGGITPSNARAWLDRGASHVIVTSYVFKDGTIDIGRLEELVDAVGGRDRLVLDLSCRRRPRRRAHPPPTTTTTTNENDDDDDDPGPYYVVTDRWQTYTDVEVNGATLNELGKYCSEFLVHGVENEGKRCGILEDLVILLGEHSPVPVTYAGGVRGMEDLDRVKLLGGGRVDLTIGSALDCFGGDIRYDDVVAWHGRENPR
ncbi:hypothetical protein ACHAW5_011012 [Stephanodiscus triporus]|uniref:5-proFAR isomerase n=1 Tax=Stephanodiscus triporus TaxID=2934178 RepID=A0ABD3MGX1_9STRA